MAITIVSTNNKGGCGKTVTTINVGASLRLQGYKVLLIDYDGQTNLTTVLDVPTTNGTSYAATLSPSQVINPVRVLPSDDKCFGILDVLPSEQQLSVLDVQLASSQDKATRLHQAIKRYQDIYDYILIDTPPSINILTLNALYASDFVLCPLEPEFLAVQGLMGIVNAITPIAKHKGKEMPLKCVFCKHDKRKVLHNSIIAQVEATNVATFTTRIRSNVSIGEAIASRTDIFSYAPSSNGAKDYQALTREIIEWTQSK